VKCRGWKYADVHDNRLTESLGTRGVAETTAMPSNCSGAPHLRAQAAARCHDDEGRQNSRRSKTPQSLRQAALDQCDVVPDRARSSVQHFGQLKKLSKN
jgi:hypothetical protein